MTSEQSAAYIIAQAASMTAELESMKIANAEAIRNNEPNPYHAYHFMELIDNYGLSHNAIIGLFNQVL